MSDRLAHALDFARSNGDGEADDPYLAEVLTVLADEVERARASEKAALTVWAKREAVLVKVRELAHSTQADQYRDEAARGTAVMPYASNRYLRLLDDLRALLPADEDDQ